MVDPKDQTKLTIDLAGEAAGLRQMAAAAPGQVVPNRLSTPDLRRPLPKRYPARYPCAE